MCLRGQVKGEHGIRCHLLPTVAVTTSGIDLLRSVKRLLKLKSKQGHKEGPAVSDLEGKLFHTAVLNDAFQEVLDEIYSTKRCLFPEKN